MTKQEIMDLVACFDRSTVKTMKLTWEGFALELTRDTAAAAPAAPLPAAPAPVEEEDCVVTAPLVGTYYAAPGPDQPPFVTAGARVKKGQTVCLLEAMKMMSEIPAPCDCVIDEVLKTNGELAAFGEPLFQYRPC